MQTWGLSVHGRTVSLNEGIGAHVLPVRELRSGFLCAEACRGPWEWAMVGITAILGLGILSGGVLMTFGALGYFPGRESGWSVAAPAAALLVFGGWLSLSALLSARGFMRLTIQGKRADLWRVGRFRKKNLAGGELGPDDHLMCHFREDAEQDIFGVSAELMLPSLDTSVTLFYLGLTMKLAEGRSADEAMQLGLLEATTAAFDEAKRVGDALGVPVRY